MKEGAVQMSRLKITPSIIMDDVAMLRFKTRAVSGRSTRAWRNMALVVAVGVLSACTPVINVHGQTPDPEDLELVEVGQSTRRDVEQRLGTASTSSVFSDNVWYYYTETTETVAFFAPEVKERKIIAIVFAPDGRVDNIATYTKADGKEVKMVSRVTPTAGNELTFLQQLFGNIGRFSAAEGQ
ncbi:MAG: outer membrane protein assembly factor BamE (lipoprotein component of BamABCDE complex) [Alphaproteobacteria bacterium]|jgi:outer membrane protein assembly factor BamE (lipoprotein component of BamABCDE complex)